MLRTFDFTLALLGMIIGAPVFFLVLLLAFMDTGAPLLFQKRIGKNESTFILIKFRTMIRSAVPVPTHMADATQITKIGRMLRWTKLDEIPQMWNILLGQMSFVGPRPCLPSQFSVISARRRLAVFTVRPGLTGLSQVRGIDMATPELLAQTDAKLIESLTPLTYWRYISSFFIGKGWGDRVRTDLSKK
jgi:O-antigen biosynthesis protein WbqP